ncbi:MAG: TolC family protein, partial [Bacteroidales bacterium]
MIQNLSDIKDIAAKTQAMADAGALEQTDADQLLVQVNLLENMIQNSDRNTELGYNLLKLQLGTNIKSTVTLTESIENLLNNTNDAEILIKPYLVEEDPMYRMAEGAQRISEKQHLMSVMNALPTVSAFYNFNGKILKPAFDMSPKNVVGLQASVPIFKGLKNTNTFRKTKLAKENAAMDLTFANDQLLTSEKQYRYNLKTALEQYATQKMNVDVALRVFKSIELKYDQGVKSSLDLTTANSNYLQAQTDYLGAVMQV